MSVLYYYTIQQNEGIQPATTPLHFLFILSQFLSHNHRDQFYNGTIQYTFALQFLAYIKGIPWENSMAFPKPWAHKSPIIDQFMTMKLQHFTRKFFLNCPYGASSPEPSPGEGSQNTPPPHWRGFRGSSPTTKS